MLLLCEQILGIKINTSTAEVRRLNQAFEITSASNSVRQALPCTERSFELLECRKDTAPVVKAVRFHKGNKVSGKMRLNAQACKLLQKSLKGPVTSRQLDLPQVDFYIKMNDEANVFKSREVTNKTPCK